MLSPAFGLPWLYLQLAPVSTPPPTNSPPTVDIADQFIVLKKAANTYTVTATDPDAGDVLRYTWNWGDGTTTVTFSNSATHVYMKKGTFTLTVTVDDQTGLVGHIVSDSGTVIVKWPRL
jgi:PKD repeat protein